MCIIVAKEKGQKLPSKDILKTCFERNNDGAGLMYVQDNKVVIDKGYMTFKSFYKRIKKLQKRFNSDLTDKALVFHFRIGTSGENDKATTHPFPISSNSDDLRKTYFKTDLGMAHNGIISNYVYGDNLSDTQNFVKDFVSVLKELNKKFYLNNKVMEIISNEANISSNKLCFLDNKENIYWYGDKVIDNGVIYSNTTYKPYTYKSYRSYSYDYDYWYGKDYKSSYSKPKTKSYTIDDFIKNRVEYELLQVGDYYQTNETFGEYVKANDTIIIDKDHNLYEVKDNKVSLIGTDADIYNKDWNIKYFTYKGGLV